MVILRLCFSKVLHISFFICSIFGGVSLKTARPSSRYRPTQDPYLGLSSDNMNRPINSHVSAPSKLPVVTSNGDFVFLLHHGVSLLNSSDFLACYDITFLFGDDVVLGSELKGFL